MIAIVSSVLVAILLFTVASLYDREPPINYTPVITTDLQPGAWPIEESGKEVIADCGSNPAEAQAKGCVWYLMSFSWTHPACYNKKISNEFLEKHGSFKFHANVNKKPAYELSQEDLCDRGDQDSSGLGWGMFIPIIIWLYQPTCIYYASHIPLLIQFPNRTLTRTKIGALPYCTLCIYHEAVAHYREFFLLLYGRDTNNRNRQWVDISLPMWA